MTEASGYLLEPLRQGSDFTVYRGREHGNLSPVLAVAVTAEQPSPHGLRRLEHEYSLAAELDPAWAARPLALTRHEGRTILILQDPGGEPLDRVLERAHGQPLDLTRFLRIATGLAAALGQVHRRGLIHKDIKPGNVLVDDVGNVWFTGFGIASQLPHEHQAAAPPEIIAGTLAYMAPEQTGRMNRSIDTRSDLYSLGVTLYQMLTGTLPFSADDPLEWVHCHIARQPTPVVDRVAVPEPVSSVVMKLLAKNAEERYQTASGLEADLRRCLAEWQSHGRIDPFPLGAHDSSDRLLIPEKLYGREREVNALLAAFDRVVAEGTPELVLVSGYSGVGKSSVVNELHRVLVLPRGLFAAGKFDQYKRDIPYATLAEAFQTLVRQILVKSEAEVDQWRSALADAVGPNGQLIASLIPEIEFIIGKQPAVPDLPPRDAQNRFQLVFQRFLGAFATPEHPLALFLDDLQWLDAATLELLEHLITDPDVRHLMLIGAYRDNEVSPSHPLMRTLEAIRKAGARMQEIVLAPLMLDDVSRFIADALHCEEDTARPLSQLVHQKTGGNPFFAIQFFTALAEEGLIAFDLVASAWQWNIDHIRAKSYTDNVVDLMAGKLRRLSARTQDALKQLACLGNVAKIASLTLVHGETEEAMEAALWEAVHAGLVFRLENAYKFLHDRIQEAAYSLIPEAHRAEVHLRIGRVLLASMTADELAEHLFDVANQFTRGAALLVNRDERAQVATIHLRAGQKAKVSAAYASACVYFAAGMALLGESDWAGEYKLTFRLWLERAKSEFLTGNFDNSEQLIGELLRRGISKVDQAAAYHLKAQLHVMKGDYPQAVESALTGLRLFGIGLPAHPTQEQVQAEYEMVWSNLDGRPVEALIDLPLITDPELQAAVRLLSALFDAAYHTDFHLFCLHACRIVNISMQHGMSGASTLGYGLLGFILGPVFHRYGEGYRFAKLACDLVEKHGFIGDKTRIYLLMGKVAWWTQPIATAIDFNRAAFRSATETGDLTSACYSMHQSVANLLQRNDPLDAVGRESERALDICRKARFRDLADIILSQQRFIAAMQGRTPSFSTFSDAHFDEAAFEGQLTRRRMPVMVCFYWVLKLQALFLSGDYAEALASADKAKPLLWTSTAQIQLLDYFYYTALTVAALYEKASADEQTGWRALLTAHREQLREWADNYPPTFRDKHVLVSAEIARLEGRAFDAIQLYEQAIQSAREHGFIQSEALAYEVAARFYLARGLEKIGHLYLRCARYSYDRWGALAKVKQLDELYPYLREERAPTSFTATIDTPAEHLDLATVVKVSHTVSGEIVLKKLIDTLMVTALQHAGAERGLLILLRGDQMQIEAEAATDRDNITVRLLGNDPASSELPDSIFQYVLRTKEGVIIDDASSSSQFSADDYFVRARARSILCLPLVKQATLTGMLYLENSLASHVFTPARITVLKLLASQAAISLENARLYTDLDQAEAYLSEAQRLSHTGSLGWIPSSGELIWSSETYRIFDYDPAIKPTVEMVLQRVHPDDRSLVQQLIDRASHAGKDWNLDHRLLMPDGSVKYVHVLGRALKTSAENLEFVGAVTDVTAAKQAEAELRHREAELLEAQRLSRTGSWKHDIASGRVIVSPEVYRIFGVRPDEVQSNTEFWLNRNHPEDAKRIQDIFEKSEIQKTDYEADYRIVLPDGAVKHLHAIGHPIVNEKGDLVEFVGTVMDVTAARQSQQALEQAFHEIKTLKDQLQSENLVLREEIDRTSMFEEIVGTSTALQAVLSRIAKVAPTDSTVLITGETGTGKELVARAIHKRSRRSSRPFVSVNCAVIPRDLIASELFGHEKGAFTGATQRRLGRFELAEGGTIFLDEIGELPAETQIALLRVLQEHEFERVGGTGSIRTNVRVIAATNRDLEAAIAAAMFRTDLFYRLNVFPIEMPPLRERREDIPVLVEYFIDRYARKAGKSFHAVNRRSLDLLQSYPWPGNIRELQNVIERSLIVSSGDIFSVDESWLSKESSQLPSQVQVSRPMEGESRGEREIIEAALAESRGRIAGPSGAAAKLRIPPSTLEYKIKALKIRKSQFKFG